MRRRTLSARRSTRAWWILKGSALEISREAIIWAGGLFEGEGCFTCADHGPSRHKYPRALLGMTDEDSVRRFHAAVGIGKVYGPRIGRPGEKPIWTWGVNGFERVQAIVAMLWPWLGVRRQAKAAEVVNLTKSIGIYGRDKIRCKHGHELVGENVILTVGPGARRTRNCRQCTQIANRAYKARKRASGNQTI